MYLNQDIEKFIQKTSTGYTTIHPDNIRLTSHSFSTIPHFSGWLRWDKVFRACGISVGKWGKAYMAEMDHSIP